VVAEGEPAHGEADDVSFGAWRDAEKRASSTIIFRASGERSLPDDYRLLTIELRDLATEAVAALPADPAAFGDAWLRDPRSAVLEVPSLIVPESANLLVNPAHPDAARASIIAQRRFGFDRRLWLPLWRRSGGCVGRCWEPPRSPRAAGHCVPSSLSRRRSCCSGV
jgi:RES domain